MGGCPSNEIDDPFWRPKTITITDPRDETQSVFLTSIPFRDLDFGQITNEHLLRDVIHHNNPSAYGSDEDYFAARELMVGSGTSGYVRKAKWKNKAVAVKFLRHEDLLPFEVSMHARLKHRALVTLYGTCNNFAKKILVMEYLKEGNLRTYLEGREAHKKQRVETVVENRTLKFDKKIEVNQFKASGLM